MRALEGEGEGGSQGLFFLGLGLGLWGFILLMEAVVGSMKLLVNCGRARLGLDTTPAGTIGSPPSGLSRGASRGGGGKTSGLPGDGVAVLTEELREKGETVEPVEIIGSLLDPGAAEDSDSEVR